MNTYSFRQVFDKANRRVRGLWLRNGSYYVQCTITDPSTGLKRVTKLRLDQADTLEQAKIEAAKVKDSASKGQGIFGAMGPTFKAYREHYKAAIHKAAKTMANEDHFLRQWEKFLGEDYRITRITPQNILAYRTSLLNRKPRPCKKRTVNLHTRALKQLLMLARTEGHLAKLPMEGIKQLEEKNPMRRLLNADEIFAMGTEALMNHERTGAQFAEYICFLMYSGARCTEALKLTWSDIDFTNDQVAFPEDISKGETRHTDFNRNLKNLLLTMKHNASESEYLFPSFRTDAPVTSFKKIMVQIREKLGMEEFTFHLTRHFFISHCVMSGIDYLTIAKWVGHKDGGVLIGKIYGHLNAAHMKVQASKLVI
jgi:integrase